MWVVCKNAFNRIMKTLKKEDIYIKMKVWQEKFLNQVILIFMPDLLFLCYWESCISKIIRRKFERKIIINILKYFAK